MAQRYSPNGEVAASRAFTCRIKIIKPTDSIWKIALLYGNEWPHWKQELLEYSFAQDPVSDLLAVEAWDED